MKAIRKKMMRWFFFFFKFSVTFIYVVLMGVVCACFEEKSEDNEQGSVLSFHHVSLRDPKELGWLLSHFVDASWTLNSFLGFVP